MSRIKPDEESQIITKINEFVTIAKAPQGDISSDHKSDFTKLMADKINRFHFVNILIKSNENELPNKDSYEKLTSLIKIFLKSSDKSEDSDYLRSMLNVASRLYYDVEEADDAVIRTYVTEGIRDNKIWDNHQLWGKAIFKDFRDIIRKFKLPENHDCELKKDDILRNVLFNRLLFYIDKLAYFDMNPDHLTVV